jgi:hypothetical protein
VRCVCALRRPQCKDLGLAFDPLTVEDCEPVGAAGIGEVALGEGKLGEGAEAALDAAMARAMLDDDDDDDDSGASDT